jgi:peptidoglycan/LPS O-acetylase OafA/YrhL
MSEISIATTDTMDAARARAVWLDRLRVALTVLVVLHHAAITYGASGSWFFKATDNINLLLTFIAAVNQAFFMGLFFMLSGLLAPASLRRKGPGAFLGDRALRLGLPVLAFGFALGPLTVALATAQIGAVLGETVARMQQGQFVLGPMWFPAALLVFSAALTLRPVRPPSREAPPGFAAWLAVALVTGLASLLIRQAIPVGESVFGFQLGYFASYVVLFVVGARAGERGWMNDVPTPSLRRAMLVGVLALPLLPVVLLTNEAPRYETGFSLAAVTYAFWEPLVALGAIAALIAWSRSRGARGGAFWTAAAANSYGAFILHAPILVATSRALAALDTPHAAALPLATATTVAFAFGATGVLRRSAVIRRVI